MADQKEKPTVTILHLSDTHQFLTSDHFAHLPPTDVLVHTGDFTNDGQPEEFRQFDAVLHSVSDRYPVRIVVLGNHDCRVFQDRFDIMKSLLPHATHVLIHQEYHHKHHGCDVPIRFYGVPWFHGHHWDYRLRFAPDAVDPQGHRFHEIPSGIDILLTHGPAYGCLDEADGVHGFYSGSTDLRSAIHKIDPAIHAFGHIHEQFGLARADPAIGPRTIFVNSALASRWGEFRLINSPHLFRAVFDDSRLAWEFAVTPLHPVQWH